MRSPAGAAGFPGRKLRRSLPRLSGRCLRGVRAGRSIGLFGPLDEPDSSFPRGKKTRSCFVFVNSFRENYTPCSIFSGRCRISRCLRGDRDDGAGAVKKHTSWRSTRTTSRLSRSLRWEKNIGGANGNQPGRLEIVGGFRFGHKAGRIIPGLGLSRDCRSRAREARKRRSWKRTRSCLLFSRLLSTNSFRSCGVNLLREPHGPGHREGLRADGRPHPVLPVHGLRTDCRTAQRLGGVPSKLKGPPGQGPLQVARHLRGTMLRTPAQADGI